MRTGIGITCTRAVRALVVLALVAALPVAAFGSPEESSPTVAVQQVDDVFDIANEEYKAGNYEGAARLYEGLVSGSGLNAADIHYNLGNAYFKLGRLGSAIVQYRNALRVAPRDQDIVANLRYVRSMAPDKIDQPKSTELLREMLFFHYGVSPAEAEAMFLLAYLVTASVATLYLFWRPRFLRRLTIAAVALTLALGASALAHAYEAAHPHQAVVVADEAAIRTGPGEHYLVSFSLHDGAELEIRRGRDGWYQVELADGRRGWMKESHIGIVS